MKIYETSSMGLGMNRFLKIFQVLQCFGEGRNMSMNFQQFLQFYFSTFLFCRIHFIFMKAFYYMCPSNPPSCHPLIHQFIHAPNHAFICAPNHVFICALIHAPIYIPIHAAIHTPKFASVHICSCSHPYISVCTHLFVYLSVWLWETNFSVEDVLDFGPMWRLKTEDVK